MPWTEILHMNTAASSLRVLFPAPAVEEDLGTLSQSSCRVRHRQSSVSSSGWHRRPGTRTGRPRAPGILVTAGEERRHNRVRAAVCSHAPSSHTPAGHGMGLRARPTHGKTSSYSQCPPQPHSDIHMQGRRRASWLRLSPTACGSTGHFPKDIS